MTTKRPILTLTQKPEGETLEPAPDSARPDPRKRPARLMPYSIKEHPEHEGAVSLARAAPLATRTDWERLCRNNPGKVLNALAETLPDGKDLLRCLAECARANGANVSMSDSQGAFRLMAKIKP